MGGDEELSLSVDQVAGGLTVVRHMIWEHIPCIQYGYVAEVEDL